jgi:hypothetical protein
VDRVRTAVAVTTVCVHRYREPWPVGIYEGWRCRECGQVFGPDGQPVRYVLAGTCAEWPASPFWTADRLRALIALVLDAGDD